MARVEDAAVQKHIELLLSIIERLASNSNSCKTWCVTVVSALLAIAYQEDSTSIAKLSYIPLLLFYYLDSYYLSIERELRRKHKDFLTELDAGNLQENQIFDFSINTGFLSRIWRSIYTAFSSASTLPFYGIFLCLLVLITWPF